MSKLKIFTGNLDGRRWAMVAATNQKDAAKALGTSMRDLRLFFASSPPETHAEIMACHEPGRVFVRPMDFHKDADWVPRREPRTPRERANAAANPDAPSPEALPDQEVKPEQT